jgi:hypothetical protein
LLALLVVCSLLLSAGTVGGTAASPGSYLAIDDVVVSPNPPTPNEEFTVYASVHSLSNSSSNYDIERIELRSGPDRNFTLHDEASPTGIIRPGERERVALTATIDNPGTHSLRIHVYGTTDAGERVHLQYTTEVQVGAERPQLSIDADDPVASADSRLNVTVANGLPSDARNVRVSIEGSGLTVENPRRVRSLLGSGAEKTFDFTVRAKSPGTHRVMATLRYTDADGERRTVRQHATVEFVPLSKRVSLDAKPAAERSAISVTVTNFGNVPITNVVVRGDSPNATLADAPIDELAPGESKSVTLNISQFEADGSIPVNVTAVYEAGSVTGRASTSVETASNPGAIRLTGIEVERKDGKVHLSGSASNVGLSEANSVIVSVASTEGVQPAHPNKQYFVGTVPASDFVSFNVFATVDENASTIPLKVTYLVDGERRSYTVTVEYERDDDSTARSHSTNDLVVPVAIGGVVVLGVLGLMLLGWRNSRDGSPRVEE